MKTAKFLSVRPSILQNLYMALSESVNGKKLMPTGPRFKEEAVSMGILLPKNLLERIDAARDQDHMSRSAWLAHAARKLLEREYLDPNNKKGKREEPAAAELELRPTTSRCRSSRTLTNTPHKVLEHPEVSVT
jgi:hypothetical protein